jgi:hypothetical protein
MTVWLFAFVLVQATNLHAQGKKLSRENVQSEVDSLIVTLYDLVSVETEGQYNWESVKSLFIKEAVIVLRTSRDQSTIFSVDGFIDDFKKFIDRANINKTGFEEKIIKMKSMVFGDIAQSLVLYQAHIPGSDRPPQNGIDNFLLIKKENQWKIVAITNEIPTADNPIPAELMD